MATSLPNPTRGTFPTRFLRGAGYVVGGLAWLLGRKPLRRLLLAPLALNLTLLAVLFGSAVYFATDVAGLFWTEPTGWLLALWWLSVAIVFLALLAVGYALFMVLSAWLGSAFYDAIARRVEGMVTGELPDDDPLTVGGVVTDIAEGVGDAGRSLLSLILSLPLFLLNFIPVIGSLAYLAVNTTLAGYHAALEAIGPAAERRGLSRAQQVRIVRGNFALCAGFGAVAGVLMLVPFLNLLVVPATIVGGTRLFLHLEAHGRVAR